MDLNFVNKQENQPLLDKATVCPYLLTDDLVVTQS